MFYLFLTLLFVVSLFPNNAHAYIDPGMGSLILQAILGFIAVAVTSITIFWNKIKFFLKSLFKKKDNQKNDNKME